MSIITTVIAFLSGLRFGRLKARAKLPDIDRRRMRGKSLDATKPLGQRRGEGYYTSRERMEGPRFQKHKRHAVIFGWIDRQLDTPHGRSGDKLARKARFGLVGVCHGKRRI